jgi:hypothetical protein
MVAMIKNDKQLIYSKEWAEKFAEANRKLRANEKKRQKDPDGWQLIQDSNKALQQKLLDEIAEYEMLVFLININTIFNCISHPLN